MGKYGLEIHFCERSLLLLVIATRLFGHQRAIQSFTRRHCFSVAASESLADKSKDIVQTVHFDIVPPVFASCFVEVGSDSKLVRGGESVLHLVKEHDESGGCGMFHMLTFSTEPVVTAGHGWV